MTFIEKVGEILYDIIHSNKLTLTVYRTFRNFYIDDCFNHAAAISFYFLLSFIPFLILLGSVMGYIIDYIQTIHQISASELTDMTKGYIQIVIPYLKEHHISQFFTITEYKFSLGTIGSISLIISATLLFSTIHYSFFKIFGGKYINFILSRLMGVLFLITIVILLFFLHYFFTLILSMVDVMQENFPMLTNVIALFKENGGTVGFLLTTIVIILLFNILLFYFTRGIKHNKFAILMGAFLFSSLWHSVKQAYTIYITKLSNINIIYGSTAFFITIILWIYYSNVILMLSLEFIKTVQKVFFEKD